MLLDLSPWLTCKERIICQYSEKLYSLRPTLEPETRPAIPDWDTSHKAAQKRLMVSYEAV